MRARFRLLLSSLAAVVLLLIATCWYITWKTKRRAERFFQEAQRLEIGRSTPEDVFRLVKSSHQRTNGGFVDACLSDGECTGTVYFDNRWLHRVHLAPLMAFLCRFDIKDHRLQERWLEVVYSDDGKGEKGAFLHDGDTTTWPGEVLRKPEQKFFNVSGGRPSGYLGIFITPQTPPDLRELASDFNFDCLTRLGGCKTYEEMLPALKRKDLYWGQDPWVHEENPGD